MRPPPLGNRRRRDELMDDPALDAARHHEALEGLARLHRASFTARRIWSRLAPLARTQDTPLRVLDVACGGGELLVDLAQRARRAGLELEAWGCDRSDVALQHAENAAQRAGLSAHFLQADVLHELPLHTPDGAPYHVMLNSLFLHHISETEAFHLLTRLREHATRAVLVHDLLRSRAGWRWAWLGSRCLTRSPVVRHDALASVESAFSYSELGFLFGRAGMHRNQTRVWTPWPARLLALWQRP
ncbi:MAG: methyltransferase [Planctomycetota bacterium]|nr:MAG: methyltransferase [Planctomycetota bacterium]